MNKRMDWNLDSREHATFNWLRPIPAYSKSGSRFRRSYTTFVDEARMIPSPTLHMHAFKRRVIFRAGVVVLILVVLCAMAIGPEPPARVTFSPEELVRAVTIQPSSFVDCCL